MDSPIYPINDFYLVALLWLHDLRPVEVDRQDRREVIFYFEDTTNLQQLIDAWSNFQVTVNLRRWISAFRDVKALALDFGERNGERDRDGEKTRFRNE